MTGDANKIPYEGGLGRKEFALAHSFRKKEVSIVAGKAWWRKHQGSWSC